MTPIAFTFDSFGEAMAFFDTLRKHCPPGYWITLEATSIMRPIKDRPDYHKRRRKWYGKRMPSMADLYESRVPNQLPTEYLTIVFIVSITESSVVTHG